MAKKIIGRAGLPLENVEGIEFYYWLKKLCKDIDKNIDDILKNLVYIKENIFNINNVYFGLGCSESIRKMAVKYIENLSFFNDIKTQKFITKSKLNIKNEAFCISSDVNYNTKVAFLNKDNFNYTGYLYVLKRIIQSDYMWYKIRTEGGAYGADMSILNNGLMILSSYSDPNIVKTYNNFDNIAHYIKALNISEKELHMYKIGTVNMLDRPLKAYEINQTAMDRYFKGIDDKILYDQRQQVLNANLNDIKKYYNIIRDSLKENNICTIGNKEDIKLCENIFLNVKNI